VSLVVIDTDVASTLLRRRASDALAQALAGRILAVTFVTVGELTKWTLVRHWGPRNLATMRTFKDFVDFEQHEGLELVR
jgi:toxin FitB